MNLNWLIGAKDRKETFNASSGSTPSAVVKTKKKELECSLRSFFD